MSQKGRICPSTSRQESDRLPIHGIIRLEWSIMFRCTADLTQKTALQTWATNGYCPIRTRTDHSPGRCYPAVIFLFTTWLPHSEGQVACRSTLCWTGLQSPAERPMLTAKSGHLTITQPLGIPVPAFTSSMPMPG